MFIKINIHGGFFCDVCIYQIIIQYTHLSFRSSLQGSKFWEMWVYSHLSYKHLLSTTFVLGAVFDAVDRQPTKQMSTHPCRMYISDEADRNTTSGSDI